MTRGDILAICKEIVAIETTLNDAVDKLLVAVGVTREEAKNGNFSKEVDT